MDGWSGHSEPVRVQASPTMTTFCAPPPPSEQSALSCVEAAPPQRRPHVSASPTKPTIARIWRGPPTRAPPDQYAPSLYEVGIKPLEEKALGVQQLREDRAEDSEFITISYRESVEA